MIEKLEKTKSSKIELTYVGTNGNLRVHYIILEEWLYRVFQVLLIEGVQSFLNGSLVHIYNTN